MISMMSSCIRLVTVTAAFSCAVFFGASQASAAGPVFGSSAALNTNAGADSGTDLVPCISTDQLGNWVAVWRSDENLSGAGTDRDIFVATSADAGANWSAPALLASNGATDSRDDEAPFVANDENGTWLAVWDSEESLAGAGIDADIFIARSSDNGATWTAVTKLNTNANVDTGQDTDPKIISEGAGVWVAVWHSTDSLAGTIGADFDVLFARSTDNGVSWTAPQALNSTAAGDVGGDTEAVLAGDGTGNMVAVWASAENTGGAGTDFDIFFARSVNGGQTWSIAQALNSNASSDSGNDRTPAVVTDGVTWLAAWESPDKLGNSIGNDSDILYAVSADVGVTWSTVAALNTNAGSDAGEDRNVVLARAATGPIVAVWESNEDIGGLQADFDILMAQSFDAGSTWSSPDGVDPDAGSDIGDDSNAAIVGDGLNYVVVWDSNDDKTGLIGTDRDILTSPSVGPCAATPLVGCRTPFVGGKGKLQLKDEIPNTKDKFSWKWNKGSETTLANLGSPLTTTEYTLCLYDKSGAASTDKLLLPALMPAGGDCKGKPCWRQQSTKGFKYRDSLRTPNGVTSLKLRTGSDGKAKITLKGKGAELDGPSLPLQTPVLVQVSNSLGECWEASYSTPRTNDSTQFKAKND